MKEIYLLLTDTGSMVSKTIKTFSKVKYNHVSIALQEDITKFYSFGRLYLRFPLIGGFVEERLNGGIYNLFKDTICMLYKMEIDEDSYEALKSNIALFQADPRKFKFNIAGLVGVKLHRPVKRKNHYFCSQFVAEVIRNSNIYDFKKDVALTTPHDFHSIPDTELIYEGKLSDFNPNSEKIICFKTNLQATNMI